MSDLPQYQRQVAPRGGGGLDGDTGSASSLSRLRAEFSSLAGQISGMADRAASAEGEQAGMIAGLDPEFRPGRRNTLYGEAYDRAGTRAWLDGEQNRLTQTLEELSVQHEADPKGLTAAIDALQKDTVGKLEEANFPEAQVAFAGFFSRARTSYIREALRAKTERDKAVWLATANDAHQRRLNEIDRSGYADGLDEEAAKNRAAIVEDGSRAGDAAEEARVFSPEENRQRKEELTRKATLAPIAGTFGRLKDIGQMQAALADFQKQYGAGQLGPLITGEDADQMVRFMEQKIGNAEAKRRADIGDIARRAKDFEDMAAGGIMPREADLAALEAKARQTGDAQAVDIASYARARSVRGKELASMSGPQLEVARKQVTQRIADNGATEADVESLKQIDTVKSRMEAGLSSDPYAWGVSAGKIKPVPALTFGGTPETLAKTLLRRREAQAVLKEHYGTVPFFTQAEKSLFTDIANRGGMNALGIATTLVNTLGSDARAAIAEVAKEAPVLAQSASLLLSGSAGIATDAMAGIEQRSIPELKPVKMSEAELGLVERDVFGTAFAFDPRGGQAVASTARAAWEKRARDSGLQGDISGQSDAVDLYEQALQEATGATWRGGVRYGGVDDINGFKVVIPGDVPEGETEELLHRVMDLSLLPPMRSGNGVDIKAGAFQGAVLVNARDGGFHAVIGDPRVPEPRFVMAPDGSKWTVSVEELRRAAGPKPARRGGLSRDIYRRWAVDN